MSLEGELVFGERRYPGRHAVVDADLVTDAGTIPVVVKKTPITWRQRATMTKAERAYRVAQALLALGVRTPEPLGFRTFREEAWYVCRRLQDSAQVRAWFLHRDDPRRPAPPIEVPLAEVIRAVGRLARTLHEGRIFFRDLSDGNILISGEGATFRLWLVDLDRARLGGRVGWLRRFRDLSRPGLNRKEDLALLLEGYFSPEPPPAFALPLVLAFRRRLVLWDVMKRRARPWRRSRDAEVSSGLRSR